MSETTRRVLLSCGILLLVICLFLSLTAICGVAIMASGLADRIQLLPFFNIP